LTFEASKHKIAIMAIKTLENEEAKRRRKKQR